MRYYKSYDINNFVLALGYKGKMIEDYFKKNQKENFKIQFCKTGQISQTGARLLKLKKNLINEENFMLTYGDGLCDVNINKLIKFHFKKKPVATVTAVNPPVRFGELKIRNSEVREFREKSRTKTNWISGGFFIFNKKIFDYIPKGNSEVLENKAFTDLVKKKKFNAFKHNGFWQCMDTMREKKILNELWKKRKAPWKKW